MVCSYCLDRGWWLVPTSFLDPQIWRELFSPLHALNFGIGGDSTQHVLWRLENGELEHIRPKVSKACVVD